MPAVLQLIAELAHWSAAVPLLACVVLTLRRRDPGPLAWWLAVAFGLSALADTIASSVTGPNAWIGYVLVPIQIAVLVAALVPSEPWRLVAWVAIAAVAVLSAARGPWDRQETVVEVLGGLAVCFLASHAPTSYRRAIRITWGLTVPLTLGLLVLPSTSASWMACWVVFQGLRLAGLVAWARGVVGSLRPWQVAHG